MQKNNLQAGIWLIGIGILAITNFWWPGIMFVIGTSALAGGSVQSAIWLFGIGILGLVDFWWPGILFLVGIGIIVSAVLPDRKQPPIPAGREEDPEPAYAEVEDETDVVPDFLKDIPPTPSKRVPHARIPTTCPACGAPIAAQEAIWLTDEHAECPYCHSHLEAR